MMVRFLGTSASPSMPLPFCTCDVCRMARERGGRNVRKRSSLLLNDDLLIDLGPDVATAADAARVSLDRIAFCLQTHPHGDHFDPDFIVSRHAEWATATNGELTYGASAATLRRIDAILSERCSYGTIFESDVQRALRLRVVQLRPFVRRRLGRYDVTPYPANHAHELGALLFAVRQGAATIFYGTDTAAVAEDVWEEAGSRGVRFDLVILDHTYGIGLESSDHLSANGVAECASHLRERGLLKSDGVVYATHLSHEGITEHEELDRYARSRGYRIAYDGLTVEL